MDYESIEGTPFPFGKSWIENQQAYNFSLFSKHADQVVLLLYAEENLHQAVFEYRFDYRKNKSGPIWHCRIPLSQTKGARYYAYRISGPTAGLGFEWHAFDSDKLLLDPYARSVFYTPDFSRAAACAAGSNEGRAPVGLLDERETHFDWQDDKSVRHQSDLIIYELHVRGFTRHPSSEVTAAHRGMFAGVIEKIPYLKELGITAVELMPVFQFDPQAGDYWGYSPLNFFAPHNQYAVDGARCRQHHEFRDLVKALHAAEIEVILDVVYNHTCEGDQHGPTYSFKGIDNSTYYLLSGDHNAPYVNFSGTGNTLHTANRAVRQLIVDSLRYWVKEMHVDGFRFDLASVFTRNEDGSINWSDPPIFGQIASEPELARIRLIAEPWDLGVYQLGHKFPGQLWMQWNGRYRDTLQQFVRGDDGCVPDLMTRIYGSEDLFPDDLMHAYRPGQSVNYICSHDGFTLYDLESYNLRRNWANGQNNSDGFADQSWNCGWEGDDNLPPDVLKLRKQQVKKFCCLLMMSNGTPMFRMGDEFLQTQGGNNNPYNQDNETSWLDWNRLKAHQDIFRFFKLMIAFRKAHPSIGRPHFWHDDVTWYGVERSVDLSTASRALAFCLHGKDFSDDDIYVMINSWDHDLQFGIHEGMAGVWKRFVDTALDRPADISEPGKETPLTSNSYNVQARSVVILVGHRS